MPITKRSAVGSTEPGARKLKELGAADPGKELPKLLDAEVEMREA